MEFVAGRELNPYLGCSRYRPTDKVIVRSNRMILKEIVGMKEHPKFSDF